MSAGPELVIVSGLSGAGRTTVMKALEDVGFYCVDNLPVVLLERFVELFSDETRRLAVVIDVRERAFLDSFPETCDRLRESGKLSELIFLETSDEELAKRFDETRRAHPAARGEISLIEAIEEERRILAPISERADVTVDSTGMSVHDLKRYVTRHYTGASRSGEMEIELVSFGFRYGPPEVADMMIDVRFLPNPNFEPHLRDLTGLDARVSDYVLEAPRTQAFLERFFEFVDYLEPLYQEEGKAYLTVAIGCTGGRHRSVSIVRALERHLRERKIHVRVTHRDVARERPKGQGG
jgi:UPF0042 nucleotide-binding protein